MTNKNPCQGHYFKPSNDLEMHFILELAKKQNESFFVPDDFEAALLWDDLMLMLVTSTLEEIIEINEKYVINPCTFEEFKTVVFKLTVLELTIEDTDDD